MTFFAGETVEDARAHPNEEDQIRQNQPGASYWWSGLNWWIKCDRCGEMHPYHAPGWRTGTPAGDVCSGGCESLDDRQLDLLA